MNRDEATAILDAHSESFVRRSHTELLSLMGNVHVAEVSGRSGAEYQIEGEVVWDSPRERAEIRVLGAIDDAHSGSRRVTLEGGLGAHCGTAGRHPDRGGGR